MSRRWGRGTPGDDYGDLAEAVERGAVDGENTLDRTSVREFYTVRLDTWARMEAELLGRIVTDAGSIRRAAKLLDVPRSTLGARMRRAWP